MKKRTWVIVIGLLLAIGVLYLGGEGLFPATSVQAVTAITDVEPESCAICHKGAGDKHQASYDELYQDGVIKVSDIAYSFSSSPDTIRVSFKMTKNGVPFDGRTADTLNIYLGPYTGTKFEAAVGLNLKGNLAYDSASGTTTSTLVEKAPGSSGYFDVVDPAGTNGVLAVFGTDEIVARIPNSRVDQGKFPFAGVLETGPAGVDYVSAANNAGCEKCHSQPFLKHGYIYGEVNKDRSTDFYVCKGCHLDNLAGGHQDWQVLVDNPARAAEIATKPLTAAEKTQYAYTRSLMNDVHMSHSMEFAYPQSMSNCVACHEGKLDRVLTDANFKLETCKSCHAVTGPAEGADPKRAPALKNVIPHNFSDSTVCTSCHTAGGIAPVFSKIHTGYNEVIYAASGQKYSDLISVTIDSASIAGNKLTFSFSATEKTDVPGLDVANITPTVLVGIYGYDTKDFIAGPHERTFDDNGDGKVDGSDARNLEYVVGTKHPRLATVSAGGGQWEVTADLNAYADVIANKSNKLLEIAVLPTLKDAKGNTIALNAPSRTFDIAINNFLDGYYSPIVKVATGCNNCHEALATTFHSPDRGGNIAVCRLCHITGAGGSHLEVQSRSIDAYIHAIHSFQVFDIGDIDFTNPVAAMRYAHHIESPYPKHGITDCESCHNEGTFNPSDQSRSMPALLSTSDPNPKGLDRRIGSIPAYITGPSAKACGGCHKAEFINEDDVNGLVSFLQHTDMGGYVVEAGTRDPAGVLGQVRDKIMAVFK
jgi:hypothetical protein